MMQSTKLRKPPLAWLVLLLMAWAFGCMVGPEYARPELSDETTPRKKESWSAATEEARPHAEAIQVDWWKNFRDPLLDQLISQAVTGSLELKVLQGRIREAGASLKGSEAEMLPEITLGAQAGVTTAVTDPSVSSRPTTTQRYDVRAGLSWELDLWGKKKRGALASEAGYQARQADYQAGHLKLVSELALTYFQVRQADQLLETAQAFLKENEGILQIYQAQYKEGIIPQWQVLRQGAEVKQLQQDILETKRKRKVLENRIITLMGRPAGEFHIPPDPRPDKLKTVEVPMGLPSDLLQRRPDIIAAEYRVLEATHRVGEAEAAKLPSLSLTSEGGLASTALSTLLGGWYMGIMPAISLPLFDGGRREAQAEAARARAQIAADTYREAVMTAFQEVEDSLVNLASRRQQYQILAAKVDDLEKVRAQALARLSEGLISQLEMLDIQNQLYVSRNDLAAMRRLLLDDTVTLFKALGGGWPSRTVQ